MWPGDTLSHLPPPDASELLSKASQELNSWLHLSSLSAPWLPSPFLRGAQLRLPISQTRHFWHYQAHSAYEHVSPASDPEAEMVLSPPAQPVLQQHLALGS